MIPFTQKAVDATVIEGFKFKQAQREIEVTQQLFPGILGLDEELFSNPDLLQKEEFKLIGDILISVDMDVMKVIEKYIS